MMTWLRSRSRFLTLAMSFVFVAQTTWSAFDDLGVGARAPGMADTFVGVAQGADALYYNPAGLVQMNEGEVSVQYGQSLRGTDDGSSLGTTYLGYATPLRQGQRG